MLITVALSTWNRASLLRQTLQQMTQLVVPSHASWELIVVDNNCIDSTPDVLEQLSPLLPLRVLSEPNPGLSNGRNAAMKAALGDYIIITDDDVLVSSRWLEAYALAFEMYPDAAVFGGPIIPWFSTTPPSWLRDCLSQVGSVYGSLQPEVGDVPLSDRLLPFGANMAFRRNALSDRPFSPELGRVGDGMLAGEETFLIRNLLAQGASGRWVPEAKLQHYVRPEQLTTEFIRQCNTGYGASMARMARMCPQPPTKLLFNRPRWMWRGLLTAECRYRVQRLFCRPDRWIGDMQRASLLRGYMTEYNSHHSSRAAAREVRD